MLACLPILEEAELGEVVKIVKALTSRKPGLSEDGKRVLSAVYNLRNCDRTQVDYFRQRLITAIKTFSERYGRSPS